ncbi:N-terminal EF-hand calcium-binding protein 2, partial [Manacus vitellinus]
DDGKLSLEEFQAFFSDGTLNEEELEKLFHTIDSDNTNNVDTKELCDYFADHMGDYEDVLASLEMLNLSILKAMDYTKRVYESGTNVEQFVTRFLLLPPPPWAGGMKGRRRRRRRRRRKVPLRGQGSAADTVKAGHGLSDPWYDSPVPSYAPTTWVVPREHGKNLQAGSPDTKAEGLEGQINRLAKLIGKLEDKTLWFDLHQRLSDSESSACTVTVAAGAEGAGMPRAGGSPPLPACGSVTAVKLPDGVTFIVYEFWETEEDWKRHLQSATCKGFQHVKVDTLSQPEAVSSVAVPAAWCTLSRD